MATTTLSTTVDADNAGRVDLVVRQLSGSSHSQVRGMVDQGCVFINGAPCESAAAPVAAGDFVSIRYDPTQRYREKKKRRGRRAVNILFEDDHLIVVDKPAGLLTVPSDRNEKSTLVQRVSAYLSHSRRERRPWVVHRLDREVSGLLVFAKRKAIADRLIEQFRGKKPKRVYTAIVAGVMSSGHGTLQSHLATGKNLDRFATRPSRKTDAAITHYRVLKRMSDTTLVEVTLETGKRHQIRVHLADAGHPVVGDPRYSTRDARHPRWAHRRIALHARTLGFEHPVSGEAMTFESPLPSELEEFIAASC